MVDNAQADEACQGGEHIPVFTLGVNSCAARVQSTSLPIYALALPAGAHQPAFSEDIPFRGLANSPSLTSNSSLASLRAVVLVI
jgi:hypothetical protein